MIGLDDLELRDAKATTAVPYFYPVWTVQFTAVHVNTNYQFPYATLNGGSPEVHPTNVGDLPLITANASRLKTSDSGQLAPVVNVLETMPGSTGNRKQTTTQ